MNRRELLKLTLAGALPASAAPTRWQLLPATRSRTSVPATYIIDYGTNHLSDAGFVSRVAEAAPELLHLGHDAPFTGHWGPRPIPLPVKDTFEYRLLKPDETRDRFRALKDMAAGLHHAGVELIFPYIDSQQMGGDIEKRLGFWEFYDVWNDFRSFGLPPRPPADPAEWLQRDPAGRIHFNNAAAYPGYAPQFFYAPCPNNEYWRTWLAFVVRYIAQAGFDGVFVDDNIIHCYCRYCREGFKRYLRSRYSPAELRAGFGESNVDKIEMNSGADKPWWAKRRPEFIEYLASRYQPGELEKRFQIANLTARPNLDRIGYGFLNGRANEFIASLQQKYSPEEQRRRFGVSNLNLLGLERPEDRLRWFETQRFWAWSIADLLLYLKRAVAPYNKDFVFFPNWGSMQTVGAVDGRRLHGKNVAEWKRGADYMMFEEDYSAGMPGRSASGGFTTHLAQYKFALSNGARPVVLFWGPHGRANFELAHAEAAAGGGGSFVQNGYGFAEVRRGFRRLYESRPELFAGLESLARVAVAYFYNQAHMENTAHLEQVYSIHPELAREHVLFDFLTEDTLDLLPRYSVFILPSVAYLSRAQEQAIRKWIAAGGLLLVPGGRPAHYEDARTRSKPAFDSAPSDLAPAYASKFKWTGAQGSPGLRANVYWKQDGRQARVVIHVLNYDVTTSGEPGTVRNLPVSLALPDSLAKSTIGKLSVVAPDSAEPTPLRGEIRDGKLLFELPELRVYRIAEAVLTEA
jgi:hypothetical protein